MLYLYFSLVLYKSILNNLTFLLLACDNNVLEWLETLILLHLGLYDWLKYLMFGSYYYHTYHLLILHSQLLVQKNRIILSSHSQIGKQEFQATKLRSNLEPVRSGSHDQFQPIRSQFTKGHMTFSQSDVSMRWCDALLPWKHQVIVPTWLTLKPPNHQFEEERRTSLIEGPMSSLNQSETSLQQVTCLLANQMWVWVCLVTTVI